MLLRGSGESRSPSRYSRDIALGACDCVAVMVRRGKSNVYNHLHHARPHAP